MKKMILTVATVLTMGLVNAQWTKKNVNNGLDEPYKVCYTETNNGSYLKLQKLENDVIFYMSGGIYCDKHILVDISFLVNNEWVKFNLHGITHDDKKSVYFTFDLDNEPYFQDFLNASTVKIRINETYCTTDIYEFNMSGSTAAFNFIK